MHKVEGKSADEGCGDQDGRTPSNRTSALPSVSVIIPTYNSAWVLSLCLRSIYEQDYDGPLEVIIADGGSRDATLDIAQSFGVDAILSNPLRSGEAGKSVGAKAAKGEILGFIDSDNVLTGNDWLRRMVQPFEDSEIVGAEPLFFAYDPADALVTRYCALIGANDPLCLFLGNYDRFSLLTNRWTDCPVDWTDRSSYLRVRIRPDVTPTMGANGFLIRREALDGLEIGPYLFDVDVVPSLAAQGPVAIAKVKIGIKHLYARDLPDFVRKQKRRIQDYLRFKRLGMRNYPWADANMLSLLRFVLSTLLVLPLVSQALRGHSRRPDKAWWFHVPACWATLIVYGLGVLALLARRGRDGVRVNESERPSFTP